MQGTWQHKKKSTRLFPCLKWLHKFQNFYTKCKNVIVRRNLSKYLVSILGRAVIPEMVAVVSLKVERERYTR